MKTLVRLGAGVCLSLALAAGSAQAEILAMMNYETKSEESLKTLKLSAPPARREGIAVVDVDPDSPTYGLKLMDIPLSPDLVAHHIFYNKDMTKAYLTALGQKALHIIDMQRYPYRLQRLEVPACQVGEDVIFTEDNSTWYLTCMGSDKVIVGSVLTDEVTQIISLPTKYPHGLGVHTGIDRILVTSTVRHTDLGDAGETITVLQASTGKVLGTHKLSRKPSPSGEAPVEILFVPGTTPPVAYVTNMYGGTLWAAVWDPGKQDFNVLQTFDFSSIGAGVPLEIYFNKAVDRMYVTTAKPGQLHVFDISRDPASPKLLKSYPAAEGAHHVAFTRDERYAFVQNALLNLPGMSDGSVTVVDLEQQRVIGSMDTLKNEGFNPNSIVLLPEWNHLAGH
ncbi:MAG: YncE family protein [Gammaproteobacteria bacterium]|nr:YncE family protein [Gammaproteobacteria bacterium]NIR84284.1 YncE family protein [Gammaproteobacteria bacterium]NIR89754.1 YncE family protein [Gammaproteobacteria bacterium]NIU05442.1 YncE family protein [Gammaproteobacteria bacterium]NIV52388.1 YncE family protein [Gammaproteobacteria bacterium]